MWNIHYVLLCSTHFIYPFPGINNLHICHFQWLHNIPLGWYTVVRLRGLPAHNLDITNVTAGITFSLFLSNSWHISESSPSASICVHLKQKKMTHRKSSKRELQKSQEIPKQKEKPQISISRDNHCNTMRERSLSAWLLCVGFKIKNGTIPHKLFCNMLSPYTINTLPNNIYWPTRYPFKRP